MKKINEIPMYVSVQLENPVNSRKMWLELPVTKAQFADALTRIGCGNGNVRVLDCRAYGVGLSISNLMETPLSVLNYLAARLSGLSRDNVLKLRAITESEHFFQRAHEVISFTLHSDDYTLLPNVTDEEKLGCYYLGALISDSCGKPGDPDNRHEFGRKLSEAQSGVFVPQGYLRSVQGWEHSYELSSVPDKYNLRGSLNEDLYGDWANYDLGA